ncbi:hypothetical protein VTL71DRAFT_5602 [Oculimacula yallundae]|uniref:Uncharacterized protein n=1 Tax=Oculimacula yallundae TaxID=86028 RepID=A0ABR4C2N9_9HELO
MPHASTGTQNSCPGASGPVTLRNGNVIPAGNCDMGTRDGYRWCKRHENVCRKHDWAYSKKDECNKCNKCNEEKAAKKKEEEEKRKRKREKDDEDKKTPKKTSSKRSGKKTPARRIVSPSTRKTRSTTANEAAAAKTKAAVQWEFWLAVKKVIDLDKLMEDIGLDQVMDDTIAESSGPRTCCADDPNCLYHGMSDQQTDLLAAIRPYLSDLPDDE